MNIYPTKIEGLFIAQSKIFADSRGAFSRFFCAQALSSVIGDRRIVQINHSLNLACGGIRGLHFQTAPNAEMKLVRCLKGKAWDVAVDLRANSTSYKQWHAQELSPQNALMMVIPEGFAHGFQALEAGTELMYFNTAAYHPAVEGGVRYDDPELGINWPAPVTEISHRDLSFAYIDLNFSGIRL
jgi:dTDP-4-dehydrorhamnose 3,5-epimerase